MTENEFIQWIHDRRERIILHKIDDTANNVEQVSLNDYAVPNFWEEAENEIFKAIDEQMLERAKEINACIEFALRNMVVPPIKGKITRGKVRWRGLRLAYSPVEYHQEHSSDGIITLGSQEIHLYQRDKKIF